MRLIAWRALPNSPYRVIQVHTRFENDGQAVFIMSRPHAVHGRAERHASTERCRR